MKTKKLLFIIFTILCFSFVANAQRGVRIGYIDMEYILENVPEYKEASTQLNGKVQRWKKDLEKKNDQIELLKINLSTERVLLTTELIEEREEDIKVLEDEMIKYQQDRFGPYEDLILLLLPKSYAPVTLYDCSSPERVCVSFLPPMVA